MEDEDHALCQGCAKDETLRKAVVQRGCVGVCSLCRRQSSHVAFARSIADPFKAVVRYHYSELAYNTHLGGEELWRILEKPNPVLNTINFRIEEADAERDFDFGVFIESLTDPAYNAGAEKGVFIYAGFSGEIRDFYASNLQEARAPELQKLARDLNTKNAYELEEYWLALLMPTIERLEVELPVEATFYRARIGVRDRAVTVSGDSFAPVVEKVAFPFRNNDIGPPSPLLATPGRLNRANVSLLYLADVEDTAVAEVRPHPGHFVSTGRFSSRRSVRYANLSAVELLPFTSSEKDVDLFVLLRNIEHAFAMPVIPGDAHSYLVTQFIAEIFRKLGFRGLRFRSSVGAGTNFVSFDPTAFEYVPDSGGVRKICALKYDAPLAKFELERRPDGAYFPVPSGPFTED